MKHNTSLPKKIWVDREALVRPQICSHMAFKNEFDPGVPCYIDDNFAEFAMLLAFFVGVGAGICLIILFNYSTEFWGLIL